MIIKLVYNNKAFDILNSYTITNSCKDVTFNDITIDFTGYTFADIPLKYQEVKIKECEDDENILTEGRTIFFGYVDDFKFGRMKLENEDRDLTITLLSPRKLATLRSTSITGTYKLANAIERIFEPLVNDGFVLEEVNVPDSQMLMNYIAQPIETIMNDIGAKKDIVWTIDENKNIKVNSINYLFGQDTAKIIDNVAQEEGLLEIEPEIDSSDYANVINIKNARLIYKQSSIYENETLTEVGGYPILSLPKIIKQGEIVNFDHPIIISKDIAKQIVEEKGMSNNDRLFVFNATVNGHNIEITYTKADNDFTTYGSISIGEDRDNRYYTLVRDAFFQNLYVGFKNNSGSDITMTKIASESTLRYTIMKFMYSGEIDRLKGIISETGQIEKNVDVNERWFTLNGLTDYGRSLIVKDTNIINKITLEYDVDQELEIGNLVEINLPSFYIEGKFAVTQIKYNYTNENDKTYIYVLQNSDLASSYIDIFRPEQKPETDTQEYSLIISEFIEEGISETHTIEEVQDED